ncbi:MAG: type 1 fimbrial protein [Metakosakonia sp.]|nr:fimbrial protein [Phytobacter sp.]MBV8874235.1 type 1 fimbrial protein [Phytobacter sp.]
MCRKGFVIVSVLLFMLFNHQAIAACAFAPNEEFPANSLKKMTVPLAKNAISVPPGTAVGSVIYSQKINITSGADKLRVTCDITGAFQFIRDYKTLPLTETTPGSKIYKTGIAGIGIRFVNSANTKFPVTSPAIGCEVSKTCYITNNGLWAASSWFDLVKTADTVGAGTIVASNLPTTLYSFGQSGSMVNIYEINLSGSVSINTPTCNITPVSQSMTVLMGSHHVSDFTGKGSGTEWKNASIQLSDCGWFYGNSPAAAVATFDGTSNTVKALTNNAADITLTPLDGTITPAEGIMAIANNASAATGIGIQLSSTQSDSGKINLDSAYTHTLPNDGSRTITIPLFARYIQTETSLSAGKAIGKLEYTISYH